VLALVNRREIDAEKRVRDPRHCQPEGRANVNVGSASISHHSSPSRQGECSVYYKCSKEGKYEVETKVTEPNPGIIGPDDSVLISVPVNAVLLQH